MLPVVTNDDGKPLHVPLMILHETRVRLNSRKTFPAIELGSVDQQPDLPARRDNGINLRREALEVGFRQLLRRNDFERVRGNRLSSDLETSSCSPGPGRIPQRPRRPSQFASYATSFCKPLPTPGRSS